MRIETTNIAFYKLLFLVVLCLTGSTALFCQSKVEEIENRIGDNLAILDLGFSYLEDSDLELEDFDPDSVIDAVRSDFFELFSIDPHRIFDWDTSLANDWGFSVVNIDYNTRNYVGHISHPILVKKEGEKIRIFDLTETQCSFYNFYHLKDETYLCMGSLPKEAAWCAYNSVVYVIDFGGAEAKMTPIFNEEDYSSACNSDFTYCPETKLLILNIEDVPSLGYDCEKYIQGMKNSATIDCKFDEDSGSIKGTVTTRFDGEKFVKP